MKQLTRREFAQVSSVAALGYQACGDAASDENQSRPNILFLLTDDQRWDSLGCMGNSVIETPAMDALAAQGCLFKNSFVTTSICAPSRVSILTGLYARCTGIHEFNTGLTGEALDQSYPLVLRREGYRTGFIGKYGAAGGGVSSDDYSLLPTDSYDYFKGFPGQGSFFPDPDDPKRHLTRIMGDQAIEFLDGCSPSQPFCLSISFKAPHIQRLGEWPHDPAYDDLYEGMKMPRAPHATDEYYEALPPFLQQDYAGRTRWEKYMQDMSYDEVVRNYYRLITGVDVQIGRITAALKERGMADNTIVIFTSDNGYLIGDRGLVDKYVMYEESIRTPLIIMDPRNPEAKGVVREEMALNIDIAPTILELAGVTAPKWMNGRSLSALLGRSKPEWRDEWFYEHLFDWGPPGAFPKQEGIRTTKWKYVRWIDQTPIYEQLFDLEFDPDELRNLVLSKEKENDLAILRQKCDGWKQALESWDRETAWRDPA